MVYKMILNGNRGKTFAFKGVKYIKKDSFGETGLGDTTVLFVTVYQGKTYSGKSVGTATLYVTLPNFTKLLANMEITHTKSKVEKLECMSRFVSFFSGSLSEVYSPITAKKTVFDLNAPPRIKRPLRLNGNLPEVHKCITKDKARDLNTQFICTLLPEMMGKMLAIFILSLILGLAFQKKKWCCWGYYGTIQTAGILLRFHYTVAKTRTVQLSYIHVTAFLQTESFLD